MDLNVLATHICNVILNESKTDDLIIAKRNRDEAFDAWAYYVNKINAAHNGKFEPTEEELIEFNKLDQEYTRAKNAYERMYVLSIPVAPSDSPEYNHDLDSDKTEDLFRKAKEEYGVTNDFYCAGYLLPDGSMLDFSEGSGSRTQDHRNIGCVYDAISNEGSGSSYMYNFISRGAIRIIPEGPGIELSVKPTYEQMQVIAAIVRMCNGFFAIDFVDKEGNNEAGVEYDDVTYQRVIADIRRFYDDGIKPVA